MNEPLVLSQVHRLCQTKSIPGEHLVNLIESIMKYLLQEPGFQYLLVNLDVLSFPLIETFIEVNPKPLLVFCARPPLPSIKALCHLCWVNILIFISFYS